MHARSLLFARLACMSVVGLLLLAACAPAAPEPTPAPVEPAAKPAPEPPAAPPEKPEAKPAPEPEPKPDVDAVEQFYRGQTIRIIVGFAPGGGFDTYSRLIARHLGKHIPGNPTVIVENMPGAGSLVAANHVFNVAPKDGTVLANFNGNLVLQELFEAGGVEFTSTDYEFLGVPVSDNVMCVASQQSGFTSLQDAQGPEGRELIVGGSAPGSTTDDHAEVLKEALDLNLRLVSGYGGTAPIRLAMEGGEVDGMCGWSWESIKTSNYDDIANGTIVPLVQVTEEPIPDLPVDGVPMARDLAQTEEGEQLIRYGLFLPSRIVRPYVLPPGTPPERVEALRSAFIEALQDPALLDEAERSNIDIAPMAGDEVGSVVDEIFGMPDDIRERLEEILVP